jgi:hypothetical protein
VIWLKPAPGFTGNHVFIDGGEWVFDYHGYSHRERFLTHTYGKARRWWPGWQASLIELSPEVLISEEKSRTFDGLWLRGPEQFLHDALPRARAYLHRPVQQAYIDGELCAVSETGVTSFSLMQAATDSRRTATLIFYAFDLLYLDGDNLMREPLLERKRRLQRLLDGSTDAIRYCDHQIGLGPQFYKHACQLRLEGVVSKRVDAPYVPGNRGLWLKTKCVNREEFVVVGWTDPEGSRPADRCAAAGLLHAGRPSSLTPVVREQG